MATIPLPTIPNVYRLALHWVDSATLQTAINVIHLQAATTGTNTTSVSIAMLANWKANQQLFMPTTVHLVSFDVTPLDGSGATNTFLTGSGAPFTGGSAVDFAPAVSAIIKVQTAHRGRANRGRVFLPFVSESQMTNGALISADPPLVSTAWNQWQTGIEANTPIAFAFGVASYDRLHAGAGAHFNQAVTIACEPVLGTQRRRQGRLR